MNSVSIVCALSPFIDNFISTFQSSGILFISLFHVVYLDEQIILFLFSHILLHFYGDFILSGALRSFNFYYESVLHFCFIIG